MGYFRDIGHDFGEISAAIKSRTRSVKRKVFGEMKKGYLATKIDKCRWCKRNFTMEKLSDLLQKNCFLCHNCSEGIIKFKEYLFDTSLERHTALIIQTMLSEAVYGAGRGYTLNSFIVEANKAIEKLSLGEEILLPEQLVSPEEKEINIEDIPF